MLMALHCTCSVKYPPFLISLPLNWLQLDHWCCWQQRPQSLFDVGYSVPFILLYLQSAAYHASASFLPPPSLFIFLFETLSLHVLVPIAHHRRKFYYWIISCCLILPATFTPHLVLMVGDVMRLIVESIFLQCLLALSLS